MITRLSHAQVWVLDQDEALRFYTEKLGFEVRTDATLGDLRWLTVGPAEQPELESCPPAASSSSRSRPSARTA